MSSVFENQYLRYLGQHPALFRDRVRQHHIEGGDPVRCDDEKRITQVIDIADLAAFRRLEPREISLQYQRRFHVPLSPGSSPVYLSTRMRDIRFFLSRSTVNMQVLVSDLVALCRQSAEKTEHKTADRLELVFRQPDAQFFVHLADIGSPVNDIPVCGDLVDLLKLLSPARPGCLRRSLR